MKKLIKIAVLTATVALFAGCNDGVSDERVALLCGQKGFDQQKEGYKSSIIYEKAEDAKVYAHCLKKSKQGDFDLNLFTKSIDIEYQNAKKELDDKMAKVEENIAKITPRQLQDELVGVNMIALSGVPMVLRYKDFLNKKLDEKVPSRVKR
jgi:hypothetical protein